MALAGLLFYNWSEDDEFNPDDTPAKRRHRYSEECLALNKRRSHASNEALLQREVAKNGLVVLEAWVHDASLRKGVAAELARLRRETLPKLRGDPKRLVPFIGAARDASKVLPSEAVCVTALLNNLVLLSSLSFDVAEHAKVNALPALLHTGKHEVAVLYYLRGSLHLAHACDKLLIGRSC